jgi:error-prone DNA polymerase
MNLCDKKNDVVKYTELQVTTNFSFLRGASHPDELVEEAIALGYDRIGITDRNTLAGIVRAHGAAKNMEFELLWVPVGFDGWE